MTTLRTSSPAIATIFRFASQPTATRRCAHYFKAQRCPFSSFRSAFRSAKRPLMTESAYRPQTLEADMPVPPRNDGVPETSIAGGPRQTWLPSAPWDKSGSKREVSGREVEARKSKAAVGAQQENQSPQIMAYPEPSPAKSVKKSKLRPRKAAMSLTPKAVEQLKQLFEQPESKLIRVGVKNRGCSGLAYQLEYVDKPGAFDDSVEQDGVKVLIDSKALFSIIGSEMDWMEDKLSARFVFKNPNITEQCGCGESFSIS